jgi:hypothetical protein
LLSTDPVREKQGDSSTNHYACGNNEREFWTSKVHFLHESTNRRVLGGRQRGIPGRALLFSLDTAATIEPRVPEANQIRQELIDELKERLRARSQAS